MIRLIIVFAGHICSFVAQIMYRTRSCGQPDELLHGGGVHLSLLTMTNPNQLCDVLLFVCSKMADETNLSSKLPVADRTREV